MRRFAVVGSPIGHSLSPVLHRAAYAALGVSDARYEAHDVPATALGEFLAEGPGRGLRGLSVTMPLKPEARALATRTDATTRELGIANTLVREPDGTWRAENHDVHGIRASLAGGGAGVPGTGGVIGSGATALSATAALLELGVTGLRTTARSPQKLAPLIALAERAGVRAEVVPWEAAADVLAADAVVSALAADGARALAERFAETAGLPVPGALLDVLYEPWPAPLAALLEARGARVVSGLEMLVHQAGRQVVSMLGVPEAPLAAMREAALAELARRG